MTERVLVLADDLGVFLPVVRSLGRRGLEVHVSPSDWIAPGLTSRHIRASHPLPPYYAGPAAWADELRGLIAAHDYRLVVPCSDAALMMLDHHAPELGRDRLAVPNPPALAAFTDKAATRALAAHLGVDIAQGELLDSGTTASELARRLGFPLVLKTRVSYRLGAYQKTWARIVRNMAELEDALTVRPRDGWLAEAFFSGAGVGVSVLAREGRIFLAWQHRRLHAVSDTGASTVRTSEPVDRRLMAEVEALARETRLTGVAMFEFRRELKTGAHVLLEVNPRFWGSLPLALAAGADFPALLYDVMTGREPEIGPIRRRGIVKRSLTGECDRLAGRIEATDSLAGKLAAAARLLLLASTLVLPRRFDSWAADDPAPYRTERRQYFERLFAAVARRLPSPRPGAKRFES